jgi:3-hydroxy-9,10-secoandrosta-1,3,5(10)-triene-9,17-dione monooxygenase
MNPESLLDRVRPLLPGLRERATRTEAERRLPDETVKELLETGLLRALQPERFGGLEAEPLALYEAVTEVATACASTAWCLGVVGVHDWQLALFPEEAQQAVWRDDPATLVSSSYAPTGQVEEVDGGYRLRGKWSFSSGCDFCSWVFLGGVVRHEDGPPDMRTFLVPRSDYRIEDDWHVMGLRGTGSKSIVVEEAFVPTEHTHSFRDAFEGRSPGQALNPGPLYRLPFGCVFASALVGPALGTARGAVEEALRQVGGRVSAGDGSKASESAAVLERFAEAANEAEAGAAALAGVWRELQELARRGEPMPMDVRARVRSVGAQAVDWSVNATLRVFQGAGSRAIFESNPLQRALRDVMAIRAHFINDRDRSLSLRSREALGTLSGEFFL